MASHPANSGVIYNGFNQNLLHDNLGDPRNSIHNKGKEGVVVSELTGEVIGKENFHNNQVPFIAGGVKQNIDKFGNKSILEKYTGSGGDFRQKKKKLIVFLI